MITKSTKRPWLRYDAAADYLGCTKRQLQRWVQQRRVPCTRMGNETLFSPEQLDQFIESCTFRPAVSA